jgi:tripartite-type tricarboxylate transporter receptor subunit TctC
MRNLVCLGGAVAAIAVMPAKADPVADFFKGKQLTYNLATSSGGSWALYGRVLAPHLQKYIPGNPNIVAQYMPGAGGVKAANYMFNAAPKTGSFMGTPLSTSLLYAAMNPSKVKFDAPKFNWVGSLARIQDVISVWHTVPVKSIEDARKRVVTVGATGRGSNSFLDIAMANNLLGTKFKVVLGYKGGAALSHAMETGETEGRSNTWDGFYAAKPEWIAQKKIRHLVQIGPEKLPIIGDDVPLFSDLLTDAKDRQVADFLSVGLNVGRTIYMPPGTPKHIVDALRAAFDETMKDPDYIMAAKKRRMDTTTPKTGAQVAAIIEKTFASPKDVLDRARAALTLP